MKANRIINFTPVASIAGFEFEGLSTEETKRMNMYYELANDPKEISNVFADFIAENPEYHEFLVRVTPEEKILRGLARCLVDFALSINADGIMVDNKNFAKQIALISANESNHDNRVKVYLYTEDGVYSESDIIKEYTSEFFFSADECDTKVYSNAVNFLKDVCEKYHDYSGKFNYASSIAITLLEKGYINSIADVKQILHHLEVVLKEGKITKEYEEFVSNLTKTTLTKVLHASASDYMLCLAKHYNVVKLTKEQKKKMRKIVNVENGHVSEDKLNAAETLYRLAKELDVKLVITDVNSLYKAFPKKEINIAYYSPDGEIRDRNGNYISRESYLMNCIYGII